MLNKIQEGFKKLNLTFTLFFTITPIVGITGTVLMAMHHLIHWQTIVLAVFFAVCTGLSITAGYHRLFAHNAYKANKIFEYILIFFGSAAFEGSVLDWCTDHRKHHLYTDTDRDPYNAERGFWYSHIGWIFTLDESKRDFSNVQDLMDKSAFIRWQHKHFAWFASFAGFIVPALIGAMWHDALGGFLIAGALRMTVVHHSTFCINSLAHILGEKTYSDRGSACDNWIVALLTYGEGYHNFHHKFPLDYRNGIRHYHYDPTKWLIKGLSYVGVTSGLKTINEKKIIEYRLRMEEKSMRSHDKANTSGLLQHVLNSIEPTREAVMSAFAKLEDIQKAYQDFKQNHHLPHMKTIVSDYGKNLVTYQQKISIAKQELKNSLGAWKHLLEYSYKVAEVAA
jgi:stearoyl-CoA desaturase (delta-9 desaturase)